MRSRRIYILTVLARVMIALFTSHHAHGQARLVLNNGALIKLNGGVSLVIDNPAANAITRNTSGHIISEEENNIVRWNIATTAATYTLPWGVGTSSYLPITLTTGSASGSGHIDFSTYETPWNNSSILPTGVTNFTNSSGNDNSASVLDRFWKIDAQGYTTKPTVSNLIFTYLDAEYTAAGNSISETNLKAQRYNTVSNVWGDFGPVGTVDITNNQVTVPSVSSSNLYSWWTLVDLTRPLPVEFSYFNATSSEQSVALEWHTAIEINNDYFTIQRSADGITFNDIGKIAGSGTSKVPREYTYTDHQPVPGRSYYRIKQTDLDGRYKFSEMRKVEMTINSNLSFTIYPNPTTDRFTITSTSQGTTISNVVVLDRSGIAIEIERTEILSPYARSFDMTSLASGVYIARVTCDTGISYYRVIKK